MRRAMYRITTSVLGITLVMCMSGCSRPGENPEVAATSPSHEGAFQVALYQRSGDGGNAAQLHGKLVLEGDCLNIEDEQGGRFLPVFPSDMVRVNGDDRSIEFEGDVYALNDQVTVTGGVIPEPPDNAEIAPECTQGTHELWLVSSLAS